MNLRRALRGPLLPAVLIVLLSSAAMAEAPLERCLDATCRITAPDGGRGSGCVFEQNAESVFVLTAAHVVGSAKDVQCEFWQQGHQSQPLPARLIALDAGDATDAAILAIPTAAFAGHLPATIPLAPAETVLPQGTAILSVGCAGGSWSTGWRGHVIGYRDGELRFTPTPANGRSGSAIFDAEGLSIVGLLRARTIDNAEGIATPVGNLYQAFARKASERGGSQGVQYVGGTCPGGVCPAPTPYLLPYRYQQQFRTAPQASPQVTPQPAPNLPNGPYPTLPPAAAPSTPGSPASPGSPDASGTNSRLDRIAALLESLRSGPANTPAPSEAAPTPDVPKADDAKTAKLREALSLLIGDPNTLLDRMAARRAKAAEKLGAGATELDIAKEYARDYTEEKLSDGSLGWTVGKLIAAALGLSGPVAMAIAGGLWLLSRRMGAKLHAGEPLLVQTLFQSLATKLDDLYDHITGQADQPPAGQANQPPATQQTTAPQPAVPQPAAAQQSGNTSSTTN